MTQLLILESLKIHRFRAFRHLQVERLGRVNLVVGKNNIGKTCLLEALLLYASRGSLIIMRRLLESRDETSRFPLRSEGKAKGQSVRYLFHGRDELGEQVEPIQIGPLDSAGGVLVIEVSWFREQFDQQGRRQLQWLSSEVYDTAEVLLPGLRVKLGSQPVLNYPLEIDIPDITRLSLPRKLKEMEIHHTFIPANGLSGEQITLLWDKIALTDLEQDVLASLHIIAPQVERVNLVGSQEGDGERVPVVKVVGITAPLPLRSVGEGMNRLFGITLALTNAKDGMLLIDEIDSGLHYSVQTDLWRLIFQVARRLDVQVFATTHSWDCVEAFQQATQENGHGEGLLISLREKKDEKGQVVAVLFDEQELAIATREQIEVR
jgi:hypothetical protein